MSTTPSTPTLGFRYRTACEALGVWTWRKGMREEHSQHTVGSVGQVRVLLVFNSGYSGWRLKEDCEPDLSDPGTLGHALAAYDTVRSTPRNAHDPVFLTASAHGFDAPETREALVAALERLVAERAGGDRSNAGNLLTVGPETVEPE